MSTFTAPSVVLVHGAWHSGAHLSTLKSVLESSGHEVATPDLPSAGAEPALPSFEPDVATIRSTVETFLNQGKDVVVAVHSYGGMPGTESLNGLAKKHRVEEHGPNAAGVVGLVYMSAFLALVGETLRDVTAKGVNTEMGPHRVKVDMEKLQLWSLTPVESFYHDTHPEVAEHAVSLLKSHSLPTFLSPLTYAAYMDIPTTYILCEDDAAIPLFKQQLMVDEGRKAGAKIETVTLKSGHSPFLTDPEFVAKVIKKHGGERDLKKL